jgi:hypothetical protein
MARSAFAAFSVVTTTLSLGILVHAQDGAEPPKPETAAHRFKNIKVLKKLPADQLMGNMRVYARSLGVRCTFCHVETAPRQGFERDDKPTKLTARKMIAMTANLNKREKALKGKVTCYTCHRGQHEPEPMPAMPMRDAPPGGQRPPEAGGQRPPEPEGERNERAENGEKD